MEVEMEMKMEVPSHFLCPISMQPMKDPVTISTGITYDRQSIEEWLFTCRSTTCPVTKQPLSNTVLTPNHTLRRFIHSWCTYHGHVHGFALDPLTCKSQILNLIHDAKRHPHNQIKCLRRIRSIAQASDWNKTGMEDSGMVEFLTTVILKEKESCLTISEACDEALILFHHLQCTDFQLRKLVHHDDDETGLFDALLRVMKFGTIQSRSHAITLLRNLFKAADPAQTSGVKPELFDEIVRFLKNDVSLQTMKASLELVTEIIRWGRNRIKAAESGMVSVLIELLIDNSMVERRRGCELMLVALEQICRCAEGRAKLLEHAAGIATVSKKILRVSHVATDRGVRILCLICRFSASFMVLQEMLQVGVVSKLCLLIQVDCGETTKQRVKQILTLNSRIWKEASCIPAHLLSSYPSSL